jgi:hypothetical protein
VRRDLAEHRGEGHARLSNSRIFTSPEEQPLAAIIFGT